MGSWWSGRIGWRGRCWGAGCSRVIRVGVCLERGPWLVAVLLGVLRAGCAYVPLDPEYPVARLEFMVADAGVSAVVTGPGAAAGAAVAEAAGVRVLRVGDVVAGGGGGDGVLPRVGARDLAYVIYTSGSTGTPKGVAVEHGSLSRLFDAVAECVPFGADDTWSWFHSAAFDFSVWEIWGALSSGGRVVVVSPWDACDPPGFLDILRKQAVTILSQTPSAFRRLLPLMRAEDDWGAVRSVILGGEAVAIGEFAQILVSAHDRPRIFNFYGITEVTVHATVKELTAADVAAGLRSPIGTALRDLTFAVLDGIGVWCRWGGG